MNKDLLNILSNSNKEIDNQQLMDYISGRLNTEQSYEMEKLLAENEFSSDAVEGLSLIKDKKQLELLVSQLNKDLNRKLKTRKLQQQKRKITLQPYTVLAILFILLLVLLVFYVLKLM